MDDNFASYFLLGFGVIIAIVVIIAIRKWFLTTLALRNFFRKKTSTILVILGSMIGTSLISGSLILNDSFQNSSKKYINEKIGYTSSILYPRNPSEVWTQGKVNEIFSKVSEDFNTYLPIYYQRLTVTNSEKNNTINDVVVMSFDPSSAISYEPNAAGLLRTLSLQKEEVIISKSLADQLDLQANNDIQISLINNISLVLKVKEIVSDNGLVGFNAPIQSRFGFSLGSVVFSPELLTAFHSSLTDASVLDANGAYNALLLSRANNYDRIALTKKIQNIINEYDTNLIFEEIRQYFTESTLGNTNGINFGQLLLIVSLFAIVAGLVLMINLYYMIADERRSELGTLRALGLKRKDISYLFVFEGTLYSLISSFAGVIVGIGLGYVFITIIERIVTKTAEEFDLQSTLSFSLNEQSLIFAFTGAWMMTFLTTMLASISLGKMPIASAIRNTTLTQLKRMKLSNAGLIILIALCGIFLVFFAANGSVAGNARAYYIYFGTLVFLWPIAYVWYHFRKNLIVNQLVSIFTIIFTLFLPRIDFFEEAWKAGPILFIFNGVVLIVSLATLIISSMDVIARVFGKVFSYLPKKYAPILIGMKYPIEKRFRSGLTITIFGFVIFIVSIVSILRFQINDIINTIRSDFDIVIIDQFGKEDVVGLLEKNSARIRGFKSFDHSDIGQVTLPNYMYKDIPSFDPEAPLNLKPEDIYIENLVTVDETFFENPLDLISDFSKEEVSRLLTTTSEYVVLGKNYSRASDDFNLRPDIELNSKVTIEFPGNKRIERTVIGMIDSDSKPVIGVLQTSITSIGNSGILIGRNDYQNLRDEENVYLSGIYGIKTDGSQDAQYAGEDVKKIFKGKNVSSIYIVSETINRGKFLINQFVILFQSFMALGLIIGMAGLAVVLVRSIHDRKNEIGILRSIGFSRRMILFIFLCESAFITLLGIIVGFSSGAFASYLFHQYILSDVSAVPFTIPYGELAAIFSIVFIACIFFCYWPSRSAGKLSPVEATRYIG